MNFELQSKFGLTLVEMIIVVAVIALLATMVIGIASRLDTQSKERGVEGTFALLESALQEYHEYKGYFPEQPEKDFANAAVHSEILYGALDSIPVSRNVLHKISDKLIQNKFEPATGLYEIYDLWGTVLDYRYVVGDNFPQLISAGPDRNFDNEADNITNR